jgi:hypothetical protein
VKRPLDEILEDLRGATARAIPAPNLTKMHWAKVATKLPRRPHLPWTAAAAVLALAFGLGGVYLTHHTLPAGQRHPAQLPQGFWSLKVIRQRSTVFRIFPHTPGTRACKVDHGGPATTSYTPYQGTCTSEVLTRQEYLERYPKVPKSADISRAVILSETWTGPASEGQHSAAWVFLLDEQGHLLHTMVIGLPPQNWR